MSIWFFAVVLVLSVAGIVPSAPAATIVNVVESGGDNEATDTITAKWTGQTWNVTVVNEPIPGAIVGNQYTAGTFGSTAPSFVDRNHRYLDDGPNNLPIPAYLVGQEYIMSGNDNRDNAGYRLDVTVGAPSTVYMLIDNRMSVETGAADMANPPTFDTTHMQWILDQGWLPTGSGLNRFSNPAVPDEVGIDEGSNGDINQWFSVYKKDVAAGTFSLFQADNAGQNMYGVVVVPLPVTGEPINSFVAGPASIPPGGQASLAWNIHTGATSAAIDQGIGDVLPLTTNGVGSINVTPTVDTTYTLSVNSPAGNGTRPATVEVRPLAFLQASEFMVAPGAPVILSWRIRQDATAGLTGVGSVGPHTAADGTGDIEVFPASTTTYTLTSTASGRTEEASVTVVTRPAGTQFAILDLGGTGGSPEPGALTGAEIGAGPDQTNGTNLFTTALVSDTGANFTLTIDNLDPNGIPFGGLDWRDRGNAPARPLALLAEDHLKNNAGMIHVTLGGLPAGVYNVSSFHVDATTSQCDVIRILVTDSTRTAGDTGITGNASYPGHPANTGAPGTGGLTTALVDQHSARFNVTSNGVDPVSIWFDGTTNAVDTEVPLSGLWITQAPPSESIEVLEFRFEAATGTATLTFASTPGATYTVEASNGLSSWTPLTTTLQAGPGSSTTFTETGIPPGTTRRFYKARRN